MPDITLDEQIKVVAACLTLAKDQAELDKRVWGADDECHTASQRRVDGLRAVLATLMRIKNHMDAAGAL